jgi:hypothetical protein
VTSDLELVRATTAESSSRTRTTEVRSSPASPPRDRASGVEDEQSLPNIGASEPDGRNQACARSALET